MLYEQLLQAQIPKEKDNDPLNDLDEIESKRSV